MSRRTQKNIGLIGLGIIGSRVREILCRKGFHVFVWNRTPRPVPNFVGAPAELAEMCDYLQIFVSDDDALLYVAKQLSPGLGPRHLVMAHSTVAPHSMCAAAEIIELRGARFIEAPFTGSKEAAEKGELVYYIAGDEAALREARPILEASGKQVIEIGEVGQATAIKIATNMVTAASIQAAAEALALVQTAGVSPEKFAEAMQGNASNSTTLSNKLPKMIEGNFEPHFAVKHMLKDMQIANRLGLSHHLELGVSSVARDRLLEQVQRGHGEEDYSAVVRKYFPDISPRRSEEADLELFEPRAAAVPPPEETPLPNDDQADNIIESVPESTEQTLPAEIETAPVVSGPIGEAELKGELFEQDHAEDASLETTPTLSSEMTEEKSQHQRGFFGRLLRRATNS
jgi:3-hydroxyisobutyrate dehydrogenase-like beta-hydroxyacid dehydrogenase